MSDAKVVVLRIAHTVPEALAKLVPTRVRVSFKLSVEFRPGKRKGERKRSVADRDQPGSAGHVRAVAGLALCYFVTQVLLIGFRSMGDHTPVQGYVTVLASVFA